MSDPTLQHLYLAAFDQARIAATEVARWRDSVAAPYAALEARGHVEGDASEETALSAPPAPATGHIAAPSGE